ncbi:MAG: hypothetical protein PHW82_08325 [Bacteroidales bacterium]|nr:hypothetical protein [Bacteroidales bacterium]
MKRIAFILLSLVFVCNLYAQNSELLSSDWEMTKAKMFFEDNQVQEALDVYLDVYREHPKNDLLNIRIAECFFKLYDYEKCIKYLDIAFEANPNSNYMGEINFGYGQYYHKISDFDKAIEYYSKIQSGTEVVDSTKLAKYIAQAKLAKELMNTKYNCDFKNLGPNVNSEFNEIYPVHSWDENKLYLTSDRRVFEGQEQSSISKLYNYSVLASYFDENKNFLPAQLVDEVFAKDKDYILTSVGLNNNDYILYRHIPSNKDGGDIYYLHLKDEFDFSEPQNVGQNVNSPKYEGSGSFDFINNELYYVTNTNNKQGEECDVYNSLLKRGNFSNTLAVNECNTEFDESFIYLHPGGDFLVFASDSDKSMGGYDLFISIKDGKKWTKPVNMGMPFNSVENETNFTLSPDVKYAYITSDRPNGYGRMDIYRVDFEKYFESRFGYSPALTVVRGKVTNDEGADVNCDIKIQGKQKDCFSKKIKTNEEGWFTFVLKPKNKYTIEIKQKPYQNYVRDINLNNEYKTEIELEIELEPKT